MATGDSVIVFYEYMEQPRFWIARDEDGYWLVPVKCGGWNERSLFVGRVMGLPQVRNQTDIDLIFASDSA